MTSSRTDVAIIGAGPNGLALAAHLADAGVDRLILGDPLSSWRAHMPEGMLLKSEPYGSDIAAPVAGYRVQDFCAREGIAYRDRSLPVSRETFLAYGDWYADRFVPDVWQTSVSSVRTASGGFHLRTATGDEIVARRVVVATGLMPFIHIPRELRSLPSELCSHAWDHADMSRFDGLRVAMVGAGQSALETAALLHEAGADVEVLVRGPAIYFNTPNPEPYPGSQLLRPVSATGEGWVCWCYHCLPDVFRGMPEAWRVRKAREFLGPCGTWWLRDRVEGQVAVRTGVEVREASPAGNRVRLVLDGGAVTKSGATEYDHVIAATGYRFDVDRLGFVSDELRVRLRRAGGAPVLSRSFESSVPGLYFVGAMAAPSFGPSMRFLSGGHFMTRRLTAALQRRRLPPGRSTGSSASESATVGN